VEVKAEAETGAPKEDRAAAVAAQLGKKVTAKVMTALDERANRGAKKARKRWGNR
jgi:hypothetical protein